MAAHDKSKVQKLSNLDFSKGIHHMALVSRGANGEETPLIIKSLENFKELAESLEKGAYFDSEDEAQSGVTCELSLEDVLMLVFGAWKTDARAIANSIVKSLDKETADSVHGLITGVINPAAAPSGVAITMPLVVKTADSKNLETGADNMPNENVVKPDEAETISKSAAQEMIAKAVELATAELTKRVEKFEADDAVRQEAHFAAQAVEFKELGATEEDAKLFKALAVLPEGSRVIEMLTSAKDVMTKSAHLESLGEDGSADAGTEPSAVDQLKVIAKKIQADEGCTAQQALTLAAVRNPTLVR